MPLIRPVAWSSVPGPPRRMVTRPSMLPSVYCRTCAITAGLTVGISADLPGVRVDGRRQQFVPGQLVRLGRRLRIVVHADAELPAGLLPPDERGGALPRLVPGRLPQLFGQRL